MTQSYQRATWSSRTAFLMATIGGAVGLGNLWRFPYVAGANGGGGFVLVYLAFVLLLGLPLIMGEMMIGRRGHKSAVETMATLIRSENASPLWIVIGWSSIIIPVVGLSYYAVVAAWTLDYIGLSATGAFEGLNPDTAEQSFATQSGLPLRMAVLHGAFMAFAVWVVSRGVNRGIELASKLMLPALFGVIMILVLYGIVAGDFKGAVNFLFAPDFSKLTTQSVLIALGQALFSLAIGVGVLITYSAYMPKEYSLGRSAAIICFGDTLIALLAGLAIFPIVFANGLDPAGGPGLIFMTLPVAFGNMPGGTIFGPLFFFLLFFAAFTTAIGMLEPMISWLEERFGGHRRLLTIITGLVTWIVGLGSVFSFSVLEDFHPLGFVSIEKNIFGLLDYGISNIFLPINALLIALFAGWAVRKSSAIEELGFGPGGWFAVWHVVVRFLGPIAILLVLVDLLS